jgi:hypothetical protein
MIKNYTQYYYEFSLNRNYKKGLTLIIIGNLLSSFITFVQWYSYGYNNYNEYKSATFNMNKNPINPGL